jgi:hypothetical protein
MNYIAMIKKSLSGLETAYSGIKKAETRQKARDEIMAACSRMGVAVGVPAVTASVGGVVSMTVERFIGDGRDMTVTCGDVPCKAVESGFPGVSTTTVNGVTTVYPADYEEGERGPGAFAHEIEGDVNGTTGEFETVTTVPEPVSEPVEMIGGWPERTLVTLTGLAPNRRMMKGKIGDGRSVCVERGLGKPTSGEHKCRIVRAGLSPLYRMLS